MKDSTRNTKSRDKLSKNSRNIRKKFFCFVYIKWLTLVLKHLLGTAFIQ